MSHDTASMAVTYVQRGWYVVQLHDVSAGHCSCLLGAECETAGKHPVVSAWQARPLANEQAVRREWSNRPAANVGIATGPVSGVWVLDVDPDHGGDLALKALIEQHGMLPETYTVWTGSGGTHYYFGMPDWEVTNSKGRLPRGLDIRGRGGQVVAPPSTTAKGPYSVAVDAPVAVAPPWLLDLIRPRVAVATGPTVAYTPAYGPAEAGGYDRAKAYAREGAQQELYELSSAPPGRRNETGFGVACRLVEFVNAAWSGIIHDEARQSFLSAAAQANTDGRFGYAEHEALWVKAVRHVGAKQADLPPADFLGEITTWGIPQATVDFSGAPSAPIGTMAQSVAPPMVRDPFTDPGEGASQPLTQPLTQPPMAAPLVPVSPFEYAVDKATMRILAEREAKRRIKAMEPQGAPFRDQMMTDEELDLIPEPEPLVDGWLYRDSLARIWGASGGGKSFVGVDLACSISTGTPWHGFAVTQGTVIYVIAEGVAGMAKRRQAWQEQHGVKSTGVYWLPMPVQIMGPQWDRFVAEVSDMDPALVIFDTQARVTVGVDENDNTAMGEVVDALDVLRRATGACVALIHHQGAGEADRARGATAVKGAMETEMSVSKRPGQPVVTIRNPKQKDVAEAGDLTLTLVPVGRSVVLVSATEARMGADGFMDPVPAGIPVGDRNALTMIKVMREVFGAGNGGTKAEITAAWRSDPSNEGAGNAASLRVTAGRTWARLEGLGRIAVNPTSRTRFKFAEVDGLADLEANPADMDDRGWNKSTKQTSAERGQKSMRNKGRNTGDVTD